MIKLLILPLILSLSGPLISGEYNNEKSGVQIKTLLKSQNQWDGKRLPKYPKTRPEITILKITIPPKTKLPLHIHPVINTAVILQGILEVELKDGTKKTFKQNDAFNEVVNTIHYGESIGDKPVIVIVFYAGTNKSQLTVLTEE